LSAAIGFLTLTMGFAFLIWRIGHRHPKCIGGIDPDSDYFTDAFALSWTTFRYVFLLASRPSCLFLNLTNRSTNMKHCWLRRYLLWNLYRPAKHQRMHRNHNSSFNRSLSGSVICQLLFSSCNRKDQSHSELCASTIQ
jgi:hypothetical protein